MKKVEQFPIVWDCQDDYFYSNIDDIEINIRIENDDILNVWIFDYKKDIELIDEEYKNMKELQAVIKDIFKIEINKNLKYYFGTTYLH